MITNVMKVKRTGTNINKEMAFASEKGSVLFTSKLPRVLSNSAAILEPQRCRRYFTVFILQLPTVTRLWLYIVLDSFAGNAIPD